MEFHDSLGEFRIGRHRAEQSHRRTEFEVVGASEDFPNCPALDRIDERRALPEPRPQNAMLQIGHGFVARGDGKPPGHRAMSEPGKLGKNEPHPVTLLLAPTQLREHALIDRRLRINKALEIERVGHARLVPGWPKRSASRSRKGRWPSRTFA